MKESAYNSVWGLGVRLRSFVKRIRFLIPLESAMLKFAPYLIPPPSKETKVLLPSGMTMIIPPGMPSARSFATGLYENDVAEVFTDSVTDGMTVVVVGANVGYHALLASFLVGSKGRVYAFEPDTRNYTYLVRNIQSNNCLNVKTIQKAASNSSDSATFIVDKYGVDGHLSSSLSSSARAEMVQTISLDEYFFTESWPTVNVVVLDVEGGEYTVLQGMRELSRRNPQKSLIMECHISILRNNGVSIQNVSNLLNELGFHNGYIIGQSAKPFHIDNGLPRSRAAYDLLLEKE